MTASSHAPAAIPSEQLADLKAALDEQANFRREQIVQLDRAPTPSAPVSPTHELINRTIRVGAHRALDEVLAAQRRLAAGTYGVCVRCGERISMDVLEVLPAAAECVVCRELAASG